MGGGCAKPLVGCVVVAAGLMVLITIIPLLIAMTIAVVSVLLVPAILFGVWKAPWSPRTKRAITGTLIYPAGAYFLCANTRLSTRVKTGAVAVAALATLLIAVAHVLAPALLLAMGAAFLALFLASSEPGTASRSRSQPEPARGTEQIPEADLRRLLEIEQAQSGAERRLLLAREFSRVAEATLAASPTSLETWPEPRRLATLRAEARFLLASATDTSAASLPESPVDDLISSAELTLAMRSLDGYLRRLEAIPRSEASLEALRILARDRGQVQGAYDRVVQALTAPSRPLSSSAGSSGLPTVDLPRGNPLPDTSRAKR